MQAIRVKYDLKNRNKKKIRIIHPASILFKHKTDDKTIIKKTVLGCFFFKKTWFKLCYVMLYNLELKKKTVKFVLNLPANRDLLKTCFCERLCRGRQRGQSVSP